MTKLLLSFLILFGASYSQAQSVIYPKNNDRVKSISSGKVINHNNKSPLPVITGTIKSPKSHSLKIDNKKPLIFTYSNCSPKVTNNCPGTQTSYSHNSLANGRKTTYCCNAHDSNNKPKPEDIFSSEELGNLCASPARHKRPEATRAYK